MPKTTKNSILRLGGCSSMFGIREGVPHLTKFDVGGVQHWKACIVCPRNSDPQYK